MSCPPPSITSSNALGLFAPVPCVLEGLDLRVRLLSRRTFKQHVVVGLAIERGVQVNQIYALALDLIAEDGEIIAVVETIHSANSTQTTRTTVAS